MKNKKFQRRTFCQSSRKVCFSLLGTCEAKRRFWLDLASQSHRWSLSRYKTLGGIVGHVQSICFLIQDLLISTWIIIPHPDQIVNNKPSSGKLFACGLKQQNLRLLVGPMKYFSQIFAMLFPQLLFFFILFFCYHLPHIFLHSGWRPVWVHLCRSNVAPFSELGFLEFQNNPNPLKSEFQAGKVLEHPCLQFVNMHVPLSERLL